MDRVLFINLLKKIHFILVNCSVVVEHQRNENYKLVVHDLWLG